MGWRGTLRSMNAAARRSQVQAQREARFRDRVDAMAHRLTSQFSAEVVVDMKKVAAYEERVFRRPVQTLKVEYLPDGTWRTEPLVDRAGQIRFRVGPGLSSDAVSFHPGAVELDAFMIRPLACAMSKYGTFVAFSVTTNKSGARLDLVKPNKPDDSKTALLSDSGNVHFPIDESIDGNLFEGRSRTGVIAFEPFTQPARSFEIAFVPRKGGGDDGDPEPIRICVCGSSIACVSAGLGDAPGILESFEQQIRKKERKFRADVDRAATQAKRRATGTQVVSGIGAVVLLGCLATGFLASPSKRSSTQDHSRPSQAPSPAKASTTPSAPATERPPSKSDHVSTIIPPVQRKRIEVMWRRDDMVLDLEKITKSGRAYAGVWVEVSNIGYDHVLVDPFFLVLKSGEREVHGSTTLVHERLVSKNLRDGEKTAGALAFPSSSLVADLQIRFQPVSSSEVSIEYRESGR